jgi:putative RNA ligase
MELRLDRLLADLRDNTAAILAAIDADPLLIKRTSDGLVLANASQTLFTPQLQHQLYAKGIVYRRDPYRLVSLPLVKIYNVGERDVTVADLAAITHEPDVRLRFLRKVDGSLIQVFRADGRVWFTTRGMLEGARWRFDEQDEDVGSLPGFDFLAEARQLAQERYPRLLEDPALFEGRTLLFELIHPQARKVTNYGELADLVFLACFDRQRFTYLGVEDLAHVAAAGGLRLVDTLSPAGEGLAEQIDALLAALAGTDEEGSVLCFERAGEVIYRVKVKSPEYLQLMRLMAFCTYERTVELIDSRPHVQTWADLEAILQEQGRDRVPEEVLVFYREHWDRFQAYLADLDRLRLWAESTREKIDAEVGGRAGREPGEYRKAFAARAVQSPHPALVFAALDGRLDTPRLRKIVRDDAEARGILAKVGITP